MHVTRHMGQPNPHEAPQMRHPWSPATAVERAKGLTPFRKGFHLIAGLGLPAVGLAVPERLAVPLMGALLILALVVEVLRFAFPPLNRFLIRWFGSLLKDRERSSVTGATFMAAGALLSFLLFPRPVAALALVFVAAGDPVAAMVGARMRGPRFWGKSPAGTLAFFVIASVAGAVFASLGLLPLSGAVFAGAAVAALVELAPLPFDDNLTVPLLSGATLMALGAMG